MGFEGGGEGEGGVEGGAAGDRCVEVAPAGLVDAGADLGADAARQRVFVEHEDAVGALNARENGLLVPRKEGAQVDDFQVQIRTASHQVRRPMHT